MIYEQLHSRDIHVYTYITRETTRERYFHALYILAKIFRKSALLTPKWFLRKLYIFITNFYRNLTIYYYLKDSDDVGMYESFLLNNEELDFIANISVEREGRLDKDAVKLQMLNPNKKRARQEGTNINVRLTTLHKKKFVAEKVARMNESIFHFRMRIHKLNPDFFKKLSWLYRIIYCSVYLRDREFLRHDEFLSPPNVELISRVVSEEF